MNESGMETMPGLARGKRWKSTPWTIEVGAPETTGEKNTRTRQEIRPPYMPQSVPVVLNRFQNNEYSSVDRLADAANANASATRKATFWPLARIPPTMASAPTITAVRRATRTSATGSALPRRKMLAYTSCANEADAVIVNPATTARIVANATAATMPSSTVPPIWKASSGAAEFSRPVDERI